jgi:hypothetical protein
MTPEQEAAYALDFNVSRDDLKPTVQVEYDRLAKERAARLPRQAQATPQVPARSSPEVRAHILKMFKRANPKYARPFDRGDRLAACQRSPFSPGWRSCNSSGAWPRG